VAEEFGVDTLARAHLSAQHGGDLSAFDSGASTAAHAARHDLATARARCDYAAIERLEAKIVELREPALTPHIARACAEVAAACNGADGWAELLTQATDEKYARFFPANFAAAWLKEAVLGILAAGPAAVLEIIDAL
jgi:hypothetical protein